MCVSSWAKFRRRRPNAGGESPLHIGLPFYNKCRNGSPPCAEGTHMKKESKPLLDARLKGRGRREE